MVGRNKSRRWYRPKVEWDPPTFRWDVLCFRSPFNSTAVSSVFLKGIHRDSLFFLIWWYRGGKIRWTVWYVGIQYQPSEGERLRWWVSLLKMSGKRQNSVGGPWIQNTESVEGSGREDSWSWGKCIYPQTTHTLPRPSRLNKHERPHGLIIPSGGRTSSTNTYLRPTSAINSTELPGTSWVLGPSWGTGSSGNGSVPHGTLVPLPRYWLERESYLTAVGSSNFEGTFEIMSSYTYLFASLRQFPLYTDEELIWDLTNSQFQLLSDRLPTLIRRWPRHNAKFVTDALL